MGRASIGTINQVSNSFDEDTQNTRRGHSIGGGMPFVSKHQQAERVIVDVNPFNSTEVGLMKKEWLDPVRPTEDPMENKKWVSKRKRGFVVHNDDYSFVKINEKHVDKFFVRVKENIEEKATQTFLSRQDESKKITYENINPIFKYYSNYEFEKREATKMTIAELRVAAENASRWAILGANGPGAKRNYMKHAMIEKYGAFAIDLGINNEMDTELNMSPEGKLRRKALIDKDDADKYFEEFTKKFINKDQD